VTLKFSKRNFRNYSIANKTPLPESAASAQHSIFNKTSKLKNSRMRLVEGELISRPQAKRVATRFEHFEKVELDFSSVRNIGQGFADELVRVWPLAHPGTQLFITNTAELVKKMIAHVQGRIDLPHPETPVAIKD
jgi:hypothetical protein